MFFASVCLFGLLSAASSPASGQELGEPPPASADTTYAARGDTVTFRHADHTAQRCLECHSTEEAHGRVTVTSIRGCRSCHHSPDRAEACADCHDRDELTRAADHPVRRDLVMSVGTVEGRSLPFSHGEHDTIACGSCHSGAPDLSAADVACADCHEEHHRADVRCASCHREAPEDAHPLAAHATCTGSGCHERAADANARRLLTASSRSVCLACHQELEDHRPGERCARCHLMPPVEPEEGR